jgi:hypothetical protein
MIDFFARLFGRMAGQSAATAGSQSPAVNHRGNGDINITYAEHRDDAERRHAETQQNFRYLPDAVAKQVLAALQGRDSYTQAEAQGLAERQILALAHRLKPNDAQDLQQAIREIEDGVEIALGILRRGTIPGSNEDALITQVLAEVAQRNQEGLLDDGSAAVDAGLAKLDAYAVSQQEILLRQRIKLLEIGIEQDLLRRDAEAVARRIELLVALKT